jgi:hypothetical protein
MGIARLGTRIGPQQLRKLFNGGRRDLKEEEGKAGARGLFINQGKGDEGLRWLGSLYGSAEKIP